MRRLCVDWLRKNADYKIDTSAKLSDFLETDLFPTWDAYCDYMERDASWGMRPLARTDMRTHKHALAVRRARTYNAHFHAYAFV